MFHEPYFTASAKATPLDFALSLGMKVTEARSVRLPMMMAQMVILKDNARDVIGYVAINDDTAAILVFTLAPGNMRLVRPTMDAVVRTLAID